MNRSLVINLGGEQGIMPETKQQAFDLFETKRSEFLSLCRWVAKRIVKKQGFVTTDDVRKQVTIPEGVDGRVMGAVFNASDWEKVGYTQTKIKTSHSRPIAVFAYKHPFYVEDRVISESATQMGLL